jgi:hypothetical protein
MGEAAFTIPPNLSSGCRVIRCSALDPRIQPFMHVIGGDHPGELLRTQPIGKGVVYFSHATSMEYLSERYLAAC